MYRLFSYLLIIVLSLGLTACDNMRDGNRLKPYEPTEIFPNESSARVFVNGTVASGFLRNDDALYRGKSGEDFLKKNPLLTDSNKDELIQRGADRYNIYCIVCHGPSGEGNGLVVERGFTPAPSFYDERLLAKEDGYYYSVISNGFGVMSSYAKELKPKDRWAVVAYIRWLQQLQQK